MLIANFTQRDEEIELEGLWQYDYGQKLQINGLDLPAVFEVHFAYKGLEKAIPQTGYTQDGVSVVDIPNSALAQPKTISAYIYLSDASQGETTNKILLYMNKRMAPEGFEAPEDIDLFHHTLEAVNEYAERTAESEKSAEAWAHGHEDYPERAEDNAKYYSGQSKQTLSDMQTFTKDEKKNIIDLSEAEQQKMTAIKNEAIVARNTAIENANIATNKADETEADKQSTEANKAATASDKQATADNLAESKRILQEQIQMLGTVPMIYAVTTLEELQVFQGAKEGDFGIIQEPRAMLFRYYTTGADGQPLAKPAWQWMTDLNITFTRESLLDVLNLAGIALSGSYVDLVDVPKRYNTPLVLDGTAETVVWDYSQSDTAVVTLTEDKPLSISNQYNGAVAVIQCYGAQLDFSDTSIYNKSATFDYIEPLEAEHITYTLIYNAGKWDVTALVYAGGEVGE